MRVSSALVFWLGSTSIACSDTLWDHNGSVMSLLQNGDERYFFYENPRQGMRDAGVTPGTLFFDGRRIGDELHGTARVFSSKCDQPMTFFISGPILPEGRIILEGMRPVFKDCKASSEMKLDRLEFTFLQTFVPEVSLAERLGTTEVDAAGADLEAAEPSSTADQQKPAVDVAALLKAGMGGDATAFKELARIFAEGEGVAQSTERSMNFLKRAGELGDQSARTEWSAAVLSSENPNPEDIELASQWIGLSEGSQVEPPTADQPETDSGATSKSSFWLVEAPVDVQGRFVEGMDCNNAIKIVLDSEDSKGIYAVKMIESDVARMGLITSTSFCQLMQDCTNQINLNSLTVSEFSGSRLGGIEKYRDAEGCLATSEFNPDGGFLKSRTTYSDSCGARWRNVVNESKWFACQP